MWIQSLSLLGSLAVFFIAPISPDLSRNQKAIISTVSGASSLVSLYWLLQSPIEREKALRGKIEGLEKVIKDKLDKLTDCELERKTLDLICQQLTQELEGIEQTWQNKHKAELNLIKAEITEKDKRFKAELLQKTEVLKSSYEQQLTNLKTTYEKRLHDLTNSYQQEKQGLANRILELEETEATARQLIDENEHTKKLLEIDKNRLELEAGQIQLSVERQVSTHQNALDNAIKDNEGLRAVIIDLEQQISNLNDYIVLLQNEINAPKNLDVRQIIKLFGIKKIRVKFIETTNICGIVSHEFEPQSDFEESEIKSICSQLPGFIKELKTPPSYTISQGKIAIKIDNRSTKDKINLNIDWLIDVAKSESNLLILGARGTGKSELANNYSALIHSLLGLFDFKFIQPKPDDYSVFYLGDKAVKPDYLGFQSVLGCQSAYDGLEALNSIIHARLEDNTKRIASGLKCQNWDAQYWIIDEFQQLILQAESFDKKPREVSLAIKNAVSLGRSLKVYVLAIGQVPNVTQFPGWNKADFNQYVQIYLGDAVKVGIDYSLDKSEENELRADFELFRNSGIKYYGLVREMGKKGYIAQLPQSREYFPQNPQFDPQNPQLDPQHPTSSQKPEAIEINALTSSHIIPSHPITPSKSQILNCSHCDSSESVSNGKGRRKCKKCNKSFSV